MQTKHTFIECVLCAHDCTQWDEENTLLRFWASQFKGVGEKRYDYCSKEIDYEREKKQYAH